MLFLTRARETCGPLDELLADQEQSEDEGAVQLRVATANVFAIVPKEGQAGGAGIVVSGRRSWLAKQFHAARGGYVHPIGVQDARSRVVKGHPWGIMT